jgi:tol-pal system beta propeller repeat protein TolB
MDPMKTLVNTLSPFDKLLFGGLGCGFIVLCILGTWIFYILNTLPVPPSDVTQIAEVGTSIPVLPIIPTETLMPIFAPTFDASPPTQAPSIVPPVFAENPPSGKVAFTCYVKQIDQICVMNADGSERKQLTDLEVTSFYPSISPDGQTIYFVSKKSSGFEIFSMSINGKDQQRLTRNIGSLYAPELSPNGEWIAFTNHGNGVWVMKPDGENAHPITHRDDVDPTWSPDGSMIAFASSRNGGRQLFIMNADGSNIRQVTDLNNMGGRSTWSPDGTKLAFYRGPAGDHNIYVINVDGTGLQQLTSGGDNLGPSWSPDGNWIAFTSFRDGNNNIYIMRPDGTEVTRLTDHPISEWQPRWGR